MNKLFFVPLTLLLAELVRVCVGACEEQAELKRSIERFKANGNKQVAGAY